jgi:hypothetical protein
MVVVENLLLGPLGFVELLVDLVVNHHRPAEDVFPPVEECTDRVFLQMVFVVLSAYGAGE